MAAYVLSNGVELNTKKLTSDGGQSTTGWRDASFSTKWNTQAPDCPFIACSVNPKDPLIVEHIKATKRTSMHLGHYPNAIEAAYVMGMFRRSRQDAISVIKLVDAERAMHGCHAGVPMDFFPTEIYKLPIFFTNNEAMKIVRSKAKPVVIDNRMVNGNRGVMGKKYGSGIFQSLAATYGRETVHRDIQKLTINEFQLRYGLRV